MDKAVAIYVCPCSYCFFYPLRSCSPTAGWLFQHLMLKSLRHDSNGLFAGRGMTQSILQWFQIMVPRALALISPGNLLEMQSQGHLGGSVIEHLPSAQGMILGSWDRDLHWAPCRKPVSPLACVSTSLCVSYE